MRNVRGGRKEEKREEMGEDDVIPPMITPPRESGRFDHKHNPMRLALSSMHPVSTKTGSHRALSTQQTF